jgi:hypothetical protein
MAIDIESGEALLTSFVAGALSFVPTTTLPESTLATVDKVVQAAALAATGVSVLAPKDIRATIASVTLSAIGATTGILKANEDIDKISPTDKSTWLAYAGDVITVIGDIIGIVSPLVAKGSIYQSALDLASDAVIVAGLDIATLQIGSSQLANLEQLLSGAKKNAKTAISALDDFGQALYGNSWILTGTALKAALTGLTDVADLLTILNNGDYKTFSAAAATALADLNPANSNLFTLFKSLLSTAPDLTESGNSTGSTTVTASDGSFTATGAVSVSSGLAYGSYNVVPDFPYNISSTNTINADGTETLSTTAQAGADSGSQTAQTDTSGAISSRQTMFDGITITAPSPDPINFTTNSSGALVVEVPASMPADDVTVESASDGSDQVIVGDPTGTTVQQVIDYAAGGLTGDTINISQDGNGTLDVVTDIGAGDTSVVAADESVIDVSQDFAFSGPGETLKLDSPVSFTGTISSFVAGDTIDLAGISATGATLSDGNILTIEEGAGSSVALNLDPAQDFSDESFLIGSDGIGGTAVVAEADTQPIAFTGDNQTLLVVQPTNLTSTISNFVRGDTIDLRGLSLSGAVLDTNNVLEVVNPGTGTVKINLDPGHDYTGQGFRTMPDGAGGTDIVPITEITYDVDFKVSGFTFNENMSGYQYINGSGDLEISLDIAPYSNTFSILGVSILSSTFNGSDIINLLENHSGASEVLDTLVPTGPYVELFRDYGFSPGPAYQLSILTGSLQYSNGILLSHSPGPGDDEEPIDIFNLYSSGTLASGGNYAIASGATFNITGATVHEVACFIEGTKISVVAGEKLVETLLPGDQVVTLNGETRPISWIVTGSALATRGRRNAATPIIIRKGALADNVPHHDLHITKGHSLYIGDVLIPAEFLVNHRSILWDDRAQEVTVYHIELETHDVLIANGAPAESYRDDGNRWLFQNANSGWHLPPKAPYAPVLTGGPIVDVIWRRVLDRAGPRPGVPLTDDPDLHLLVDGTRLDAGMRTGDFYIFNLRHAPAEIRIISRAAVPQELGLARDPRCLGVAVKRMVVRQKARFQKFEADDALLHDGFHAFEADNRFRWTDGDAGLPLEMFAGLAGPVEVVLHIGATTQYIEGIAAARAA